MKGFTKKHYLIIILILANLIFAFLFGNNFGDSYDEQARYDTAIKTIDIFREAAPDSQIGDKGQIYFVTAKIGGDLIRLIDPALSHIQAWHQIHFFTFLLAVIGMYSICLNYLTPTESFLAAALFNTQPLLFGQAFINPKDIPFLSLFLLTVASGLKINIRSQSSQEKFQFSPRLMIDTLNSDWSKLRFPHKLLFMLALIPLALSLILVVMKDSIQPIILNQINGMREGWFLSVLNQAASIVYKGNLLGGITLENVKTAYPLFVVSGSLVGAAILLFISVNLFTSSSKRLTGYSDWKTFKYDLVVTLKDPWIYLAGFVLGFSISNRSLGIVAGIYVIFYFWFHKRSKFLPLILIYGGFTAIVLYLTWPSLWTNPILGVFKSIFSISSFSWGGKTLFWGVGLRPNELPWSYFPTLIGIQLTIPALLLCLVGLGVFFVKRKEYKLDTVLFIIIAIWFVLPFFSILLLHPSIYDNFRHFLFITPPIFFFAGLGIKFLLSKLGQPVLSLVFVLIMLIPGIIGIVQLHPYQYTYYNEFIGGVNGAFRDFETDYWYTSYMECINHLNEIAPASSTILVYGPAHIVESYAREDLAILTFDNKNQEAQLEKADYFILTTRGNKDLELAQDHQIIYEVVRDGATLGLIKQSSP